MKKRRSFKAEEVDSAERSRTMMTKNKPLDLVFRSLGLPLNSTSCGMNTQSWKGTKEEQRTVRRTAEFSSGVEQVNQVLC